MQNQIIDIRFHIKNYDTFFSLYYLNYKKEINDRASKELLKDKYFKDFSLFYYLQDEDLENNFLLYINQNYKDIEEYIIKKSIEFIEINKFYKNIIINVDHIKFFNLNFIFNFIEDENFIIEFLEYSVVLINHINNNHSNKPYLFMTSPSSKKISIIYHTLFFKFLNDKNIIKYIDYFDFNYLKIVEQIFKTIIDTLKDKKEILESLYNSKTIAENNKKYLELLLLNKEISNF